MSAPVQGAVAPGFEPLAATFRENFARRGEVGASFCAVLDGRVVADLWGGVADRATGRAWEADTLCPVWSTTKGLVAACFLLLADKGGFDYDRPVGHYWPELGRGDRARLTGRDLLNHRSGLSTIEAPLSFPDFEDHDKVSRACERQAPLWEPGAQQGYGPVSWGAFAGQLFRRAAGVTVGRFLARELAGPLGADVHLGTLPDAERGRVGTVYPAGLGPGLRLMGAQLLGRDSLEGRLYRRMLLQPRSATSRAFRSRPMFERVDMSRLNDPALQRLELPWANALASARGLARLYQALACGGALEGVTVCRPAALEAVHPRQSWAEADAVMLKPLGFSQGFLKDELTNFSPHVETFGHAGMGGSFGFADPTLRLSYAYVLNRMDIRVRPERTLALCHALYACAGLSVTSTYAPSNGS